MFVITVEVEGQEPKRYEFDQDEVKIGRDPGADVHLPSSNVSKRHARIVKREGKHFIVDRKSTNGSFVNGTRVTTPQVLKNGDRLFIGDFIMIFEAEEAAEAAPTPPPMKKKRGQKGNEVAPADPSTEATKAKAPPPLPKKHRTSTEIKATVEMPAVEDLPDLPHLPKAEVPEPPAPPAPPETPAPAPDMAATLPAEGIAIPVNIASELFSRLLDDPLFEETSDIFAAGFGDDAMKTNAAQALATLMAGMEPTIEGDQAAALSQRLLSEVFGLGPIDDLLKDTSVDAFMALSSGKVFASTADGPTTPMGFTCPDAFLLAAARLFAMAGGEVEEVEDEPISFVIPGLCYAQIKMAIHGDSWVHIIRLPRSNNVLAGRSKKVVGEITGQLQKGGTIMVSGMSRRARMDAVQTLLNELEENNQVVCLGMEGLEIPAQLPCIMLPVATDGMDLEARLSEAYSLTPSWVVIESPIMMNTPVIDILASTFTGVIWSVPACSCDQALKTLKNVIMFQTEGNADQVAQFIDGNLDMALIAGLDKSGGGRLLQAERISGVKGGMVVAENIYKKK